MVPHAEDSVVVVFSMFESSFAFGPTRFSSRNCALRSLSYAVQIYLKVVLLVQSSLDEVLDAML